MSIFICPDRYQQEAEERASFYSNISRRLKDIQTRLQELVEEEEASRIADSDLALLPLPLSLSVEVEESMIDETEVIHTPPALNLQNDGEIGEVGDGDCSGLLYNMDIHVDMEKVISEPVFLALSNCDTTCLETVRQNACEKLVVHFPPVKPPDKASRVSLPETGALVLTDVDGSAVWQTNASAEDASAEDADFAELFNSGLLVLKNSTDHIIWQSFDFRTDTLVPSQSFTTINKYDFTKEKENTYSKSFVLVLRNSVDLCQQNVRSKDYEELIFDLPPAKPPDEFVNALEVMDRELLKMESVNDAPLMQLELHTEVTLNYSSSIVVVHENEVEVGNAKSGFESLTFVLSSALSVYNSSVRENVHLTLLALNVLYKSLESQCISCDRKTIQFTVTWFRKTPSLSPDVNRYFSRYCIVFKEIIDETWYDFLKNAGGKTFDVYMLNLGSGNDNDPSYLSRIALGGAAHVCVMLKIVDYVLVGNEAIDYSAFGYLILFKDERFSNGEILHFKIRLNLIGVKLQPLKYWNREQLTANYLRRVMQVVSKGKRTLCSICVGCPLQMTDEITRKNVVKGDFEYLDDVRRTSYYKGLMVRDILDEPNNYSLSGESILSAWMCLESWLLVELVMKKWQIDHFLLFSSPRPPDFTASYLNLEDKVFVRGKECCMTYREVQGLNCILLNVLMRFYM